MASPSSTSSSELAPFERVRPSRFPAALVAFLVAVVAIEAVVRTHHDWFSDLASWQWESKRRLMDEGRLDGEVAIFGTSVLFHGLDPVVLDAGPTGTPQASNLALNGMLLQHQAQLLHGRIRAGKPPALAILEFRHVTVEHDSWLRGPYFRSWARFGEFAQSRFYYWNPPLALTFLTNRTLWSFRYRESIDNWVFESARERRPARATRDRNRATAEEMVAHRGLARATFEGQSLAGRSDVKGERRWEVDTAGDIWLRRFLQTARAARIPVVLLVPPAPPTFVELAGPEGYRAMREAYVAVLRRDFPDLEMPLVEPTGYTLADFADKVHFSARGREKFSRDVAAWLSTYRPAALAKTAR